MIHTWGPFSFSDEFIGNLFTLLCIIVVCYAVGWKLMDWRYWRRSTRQMGKKEK